MLVLSRKRTESIRIADEIEVTVLSVHGGTVRLGLTAPPEIRIAREETLPTQLSEHALQSVSGQREAG